MQMRSASAARAIQFLVGRIADQAKLDGLILSALELKTLSYCKETSTAEDIADAERFDAEYDVEEYEAKIAKLIRRCYDRDKAQGQSPAWNRALAALQDEEDRYLAVMVHRAGIEESSILWFIFDSLSVPGFIATIVVVSTGAILGFTHLGEKLFPNDFLRLGLLLSLAGVLWGIGTIEGRGRFG